MRVGSSGARAYFGWVGKVRVLCATSCILLMAGCGGETTPPSRFATTIRPLAAILQPVAGEDVPALLSPGASPHTHDPRPSDVRAAGSADALFFGAFELDGWAARLDAPRSVALLDLVPDSLRLRTSGSIDPHFWLDPITVQAMLPALADTMCAVAADRCARFRENTQTFSRELTVIHDSLTRLMQPFRGRRVLLAHPFLGYFANRYGVEVAGIIEVIPGSEPTPRGMEQMIRIARESDADAIFTLPQHDARAAQAVSQASGVPVHQLDPIGGGSNGYAELLYYNAHRIRSALDRTDPNP